MKLIDTDILIDFSRGRKEALDYIEALDGGNLLSLSQVTEMEFILGCRNKKEMELAQELLDRFRTLPIRETISQRGRNLLKTYHTSHGLGILDALIAATALEEGIALASRNKKHYQMIPDLRLEIPY